MIEPRLLLCSGVTIPEADPVRTGRRLISLDSLGWDPNVKIRLEDVARVLMRRLTPRLIDLLEIASYVFSADTATRRGEQWSDSGSTEPWGRDFHFVIPVRDFVFWQREDVREQLIRTLDFLSNDVYHFDFRQLTEDRPTQQYLEMGKDWDDWPFHSVDRVIMFSGGLDSLAGAAYTAKRGENLVLVSHRPVSTLSRRQKQLFAELQRTYKQVQMIHIPVWINKEEKLGHEPTQRTRSFLFTAIGMIVAHSMGVSGVRFFENGIVSLNLPVADEVQRARASRTTHPWALRLLSDLCSLVADHDFVVDNPFFSSFR